MTPKHARFYALRTIITQTFWDNDRMSYLCDEIDQAPISSQDQLELYRHFARLRLGIAASTAERKMNGA